VDNLTIAILSYIALAGALVGYLVVYILLNHDSGEHDIELDVIRQAMRDRPVIPFMIVVVFTIGLTGFIFVGIIKFIKGKVLNG